MTVLVTGGAGYIGGHMTLGLSTRARMSSCSTICRPGSTGRCPTARSSSSAISATPTLVARLIDEHGIDAIAHFAAKIVVPESVTDPLGYYLNNTSNARTLIECADQGRGARHFIFSSTAAVYGETSARAGVGGRRRSRRSRPMAARS